MKRILLISIILLLIPITGYAGTVTTSGITAQIIIDRAKSNLDAEPDPYFVQSDYIYWTDEAVRTVVNLTRCLESAVTEIHLLTNTRRYSFATAFTFIDIQTVEHDSGDTTDHKQIKTLNRVNKNYIGKDDSVGRPQAYCLWNNQLEISPIPRSVLSGTTLYVYAVSLPSGVTLSESPIETPAYLDTSLVYYVTAMGFYKDEKMELGDKWMLLFNARVKDYMINVQRREPVE